MVRTQRHLPSDEPVVPDTVAGRWLATYLATFNTGDSAALRSLMTTTYGACALEQESAGERALWAALLFKSTAGLRFHSTEYDAEYAITALARAHLTGEWFRITLTVGDEPPHCITQCDVSFTPRPAHITRPAQDDGVDLLSAVEAWLDMIAVADLFSGVVLIAKDDAPVFLKAYGWAHKGKQVLNHVNTRFAIASMNKMVTSVAIAQLAEQGQLSFSAPFSTYLPTYPRQIADKVTVHHLLTHTSGLGSYWNAKFTAAEACLHTVTDFLPLFMDDPLSFEPGETWAYSNAGFIILGAIIEQIAGRSYAEYVHEHIYVPAKMWSTDVFEADQSVPPLAAGYTRLDAEGLPNLNAWREVPPGPTRKSNPSGGGTSTVQDLFRFARALQTGRLLSPPYTDLVLEGKATVPNAPGMQYAYGFQDVQISGRHIVGHDGSFPGVNGQLDIYRDLGYTIAILANYDPPAAGRVAWKLREMIM